MAVLVSLALRTLILLFFIYSGIIVEAHRATRAISSCDNTPHPHICHKFMNNQTKLAFGDLALRVTKDQACEAHRIISSMVTSMIRSHAAKLGWSDCLELMEDTNDLLDQAINSKNGLSTTTTSSMDDVRTYLSAAIANHESCKNGFLDHNLGTPDVEALSFVVSNFTKLLSNALAIHSLSAPTTLPMTHKRRVLEKGLPLWVSYNDRRLLKQSKVGGPRRVDLVVDRNGLGHYKTISEAIFASSKLRRGSTRRFVIHVKAGVYMENVEITKKMKNLMLIGDGIDITIVRGNRNVVDGYTTFRSATFAVSGDGFIARDITFENTAGPAKHQAVALRSGSDFSVFYRCSFKGYQDTLYVHSKRQFYQNCDIYGTVDFIFGDAAVVLQSCNIYVRRPNYNQKATITAHGRSDPNENTGIIIHNSRIMATAELKQVEGSSKITYLGRPWKEYSRTVIMKCFLDSLINPQGWLPWNGAFALNTLYYGEYMNFGPGSSTTRRVNWTGYHIITNPAVALRFTAENFLAGDLWIPVTRTPYIAAQGYRPNLHTAASHRLSLRHHQPSHTRRRPLP